MEKGPSVRLDALRPVLKEHWAARLRQAPASPPGARLVTPGMLVFMVDGTIDQLTADLGRRPAPVRRPRETARFSTVHTGCQCGLHLLLTYYLAGARALRAALPVEPGPARRRVLRSFNWLAREEMAALCGVCRHRGGALCQLRSGPEQGRAVNPPSAASPATPSATGRSPGGTPG